MTSSTRDKMIAGAADLMSRHGVNATSMRDVVRHTATPRGSIGHHFPDGKRQLIAEAVIFAGKQVSVPLERAMNERGVIGGLAAFVASWRRRLEATGWRVITMGADETRAFAKREAEKWPALLRHAGLQPD